MRHKRNKIYAIMIVLQLTIKLLFIIRIEDVLLYTYCNHRDI